MRRLLWIVAALLFVLPAGESHAQWINISVPVFQEGATAPVDTTVAWINSANGGVYRYHSWATVWLDAGQWIEFSSSGVDQAGSMKFGHGVAGDTTTTSNGCDGFAFADSTYVSAWSFQSDGSGTLVDTSVQLFECKAAGVTDVLGGEAWTTMPQEYGTKKAIFGGSGVYACFLSTGTEAPDRPMLRFLVHRFSRKT